MVKDDYEVDQATPELTVFESMDDAQGTVYRRSGGKLKKYG